MRGITHPEAMADFRANDEGWSNSSEEKRNRRSRVGHTFEGKITKVIRRKNSKNGNPRYRFTLEWKELTFEIDSLPDVMWAYARNWTTVEGKEAIVDITRGRWGWYFNRMPEIK